MAEPPYSLDKQVDFAAVIWPGMLSALVVIGMGVFGVPKVLALAQAPRQPGDAPDWMFYMLAVMLGMIVVFGFWFIWFLLRRRKRAGLSIGPRGILVPGQVANWIAWSEVRGVRSVNLESVGYRPMLIVDLEPGTLQRVGAGVIMRWNPTLIRFLPKLNLLAWLNRSPGMHYRRIDVADNELVMDLLMLNSPTGNPAVEDEAVDLIRRHVARVRGQPA